MNHRVRQENVFTRVARLLLAVRSWGKPSFRRGRTRLRAFMRRLARRRLTARSRLVLRGRWVWRLSISSRLIVIGVTFRCRRRRSVSLEIRPVVTRVSPRRMTFRRPVVPGFLRSSSVTVHSIQKSRRRFGRLLTGNGRSRWCPSRWRGRLPFDDSRRRCRNFRGGAFRPSVVTRVPFSSLRRRNIRRKARRWRRRWTRRFGGKSSRMTRSDGTIFGLTGLCLLRLVSRNTPVRVSRGRPRRFRWTGRGGCRGWGTVPLSIRGGRQTGRAVVPFTLLVIVLEIRLIRRFIRGLILSLLIPSIRGPARFTLLICFRTVRLPRGLFLSIWLPFSLVFTAALLFPVLRVIRQLLLITIILVRGARSIRGRRAFRGGCGGRFPVLTGGGRLVVVMIMRLRRGRRKLGVALRRRKEKMVAFWRFPVLTVRRR